VSFLSELGVGIAIGMLAGTTGTRGSARGRMTLLAAVIGLLAGLLLDGALGALLCLLGAILACLAVSDLVAASRRPGSLGFLLALAALLVLVVAIAVPELVALPVIALAYLGFSRRRAHRRYDGLYVRR